MTTKKHSLVEVEVIIQYCSCTIKICYEKRIPNITLASSELSLAGVDCVESICLVNTEENSNSPSKKTIRGMWKEARVLSCGGSRRSSCGEVSFFFFLSDLVGGDCGTVTKCIKQSECILMLLQVTLKFTVCPQTALYYVCIT